MNSSPVYCKIETIPTRETGYAMDVDKGSGKPSLPQDMADRVREVIRKEYERLDRNKAALGRLFSRSPQALVQILEGTNAPSMETAIRVAAKMGLTHRELLLGPDASDADQRRVAELETQVRVLTHTLDRLQNENETLRAALAPRLSSQSAKQLTAVGDEDVAKRKAMRDGSALANIPSTPVDVRGNEGDVTDAALPGHRGLKKRSPSRRRHP